MDNDDELLIRIQKFWNEQGLSKSQIGNIIGKSGNAVIGLIYRARLAGMHFEIRQKRVPVREKKVVNGISRIMTFIPPPKTKQKPVKLIPTKGLTIIDIEGDQCHAVIGKTKQKIFSSSCEHILSTYCGKPTVDDSLYCETHKKVFRQPLPPRRK